LSSAARGISDLGLAVPDDEEEDYDLMGPAQDTDSLGLSSAARGISDLGLAVPDDEEEEYDLMGPAQDTDSLGRSSSARGISDLGLAVPEDHDEDEEDEAYDLMTSEQDDEEDEEDRLSLSSLLSSRRRDDLYDDDDEEEEDDEDMEDLDDEMDGDPDFKPKFDIMALLNEQISSYRDMTLSERMDEIEVDTMEISLEELAAYVKENRKRRGA
ncbi:MAG: hypothetical protein IKI21_10185, partial [Oscillospiraceae bacterium]|nr:hypothetical protein [Oscillospiraceae bacterium]